MTLSINIPNHRNTLDASELTRDEVIEQLYEYWIAGVELSECTTDLPSTICEFTSFDQFLANIMEEQDMALNQATEDDVKEALLLCVLGDWDTLHDLINDHDEDFAEACLEYASGCSLDYAYDNYIGQYDSDKDYAMEVFDVQIPDNLKAYIDWDIITNDMMMDVVEINGYYFFA